MRGMTTAMPRFPIVPMLSQAYISAFHTDCHALCKAPSALLLLKITSSLIFP